MFARLIAALDARSIGASGANASPDRDARIYVSAESEEVARSIAGVTAEVAPANEYCFTSKVSTTPSDGWTQLSLNQIVTDRKEGRYLASVEYDGAWFAISKFILTLFICQGTDVLLFSVPPELIQILLLTCSCLIAPVPAERDK